MAWLRLWVSRLMIAVRRRRHRSKPMPVPISAPVQGAYQAPKTGLKSTPASAPISTNIPEPAIATARVTPLAALAAPAAPAAPAIPALSSFEEKPVNPPHVRHQESLLPSSQRPPPLTRMSDSVLNAPIRTSTEGESTTRAEPWVQQQRQEQLSIQPPEDEVRKQAFYNPDHLSPGEWEHSSRPSRCTSVSSCISTSKDLFRSKASTDGESLNAQLRRKRIECHRDRRFEFIPKQDQESLITIPNIEKEIRDSDVDYTLEQADIPGIAKRAFNTAPKLFAIIACLGRGADIRLLFEMELSDKDLPLGKTTLPGKEVRLRRNSGEIIEGLESWTDVIREDFYRIQWWMLAPFFEFQKHYDLEDGRILPFIRFTESADMKQEKRGGYGEVYPARFHPSHHNFWPSSDNMDSEPLLAIKQLFSNSEEDFQKERIILEMLDSSGDHPHRIKLLATFKYQGKYHLVFRYADANLKKYWKDRPLPSFDKATVRWSLKQMAGLADSLVSIHEISVKCGLGEGGASPAECLKRFGWHGDIKAENTLWFLQYPGSSNGSGGDEDDDRGILQLADFGRSRVHGRDSRSNVPWNEIFGCAAYEPPEMKLHLQVWRAYDIWSLGCLYLEFITWLLEGSDAITSITQTRGGSASSSMSHDQSFFSIVKGHPVVRQEVLDWVARLHGHEKCSALIHHLLKTITSDMLCPVSLRSVAKWVASLFNTRLKAADRDDDYLLKPVPWRQQQIAQGSSMHSSSSASIKQGSTHLAKRMSVTFENEEKGLTALDSEPKSPKDLLLRNEGTPGQRLTRATTFKI